MGCSRWVVRIRDIFDRYKVGEWLCNSTAVSFEPRENLNSPRLAHRESWYGIGIVLDGPIKISRKFNPRGQKLFFVWPEHVNDLLKLFSFLADLWFPHAKNVPFFRRKGIRWKRR